MKMKGKFPIWRKIKIGLKKNRPSLLAAKGSNMLGSYMLFDPAKLALGQIAFSEGAKSRNLNLYLVSPKDVGFDGPVKYNSFVEKVIAEGLGYCPETLAPEFCAQSLGLDGHTHVHVVMETLVGDSGIPAVFLLENVGKNFILSCSDTTDPMLCYPDQVYLFSG
jgi:hypothetical protein